MFLYLCTSGPVAQLNRVSDYGSEGYRFDSCRGHEKAASYGGLIYYGKILSFPAFEL